MIDYKYTTDQFIIEELYTPSNSKGGHKPRPLTSSWGMNEHLHRPRRPVVEEERFFFDDMETGCTIASCDWESLQFAIEDLIARGYKFHVRTERVERTIFKRKAFHKRPTIKRKKY
jgi:hypothetical protein